MAFFAALKYALVGTYYGTNQRKPREIRAVFFDLIHFYRNPKDILRLSKLNKNHIISFHMPELPSGYGMTTRYIGIAINAGN